MILWWRGYRFIKFATRIAGCPHRDYIFIIYNCLILSMKYILNVQNNDISTLRH